MAARQAAAAGLDETAMSYPWQDRAGRLQPLKLGVLLLLLAPLALVAQVGLTDPRWLNAMVHESGLWAVRFLFASLALTPLRATLAWPELALVRRMTGVAAACYAGLHLLLYIADMAFDLGKVLSEIWLRVYLTIGFAALLMLLALAATSTDGMVKRLGGRRWQALHRLVYPAAILAAIHFFLQSKLDIREPTIMAGLLLWLLAWRVVNRSGGAARSPWVLLALALGAGLATAGLEALVVWWSNGIDPLRVLQANLGFARGLRPAWWVLAAGVAVALVAWPRQRAQQRRRARRLQPHIA